MTKNTIFKFMKARIGFKDVEKIAENMIYKQKSGDYSRDAKYLVVKDLMKHKMNDALKCIKTAKKELKKSNDNLSKIVRKGTIVRNEYMELVDKELNEAWTEAKTKNEEKVTWNIHKHKDTFTNNDGTFKGVFIGDKELEALEKEPDTAAKQCESKAVVYAGIKVTKNEEDILTLPPDHAIFPRVDIEEFDTEMEKCNIKCQWEVNKEERMFEQKKAREEASEEVEKTKECVEGDDKVKNSLHLKI